MHASERRMGNSRRARRKEMSCDLLNVSRKRCDVVVVPGHPQLQILKVLQDILKEVKALRKDLK
jgi:hypothetical protein